MNHKNSRKTRSAVTTKKPHQAKMNRNQKIENKKTHLDIPPPNEPNKRSRNPPAFLRGWRARLFPAPSQTRRPGGLPTPTFVLSHLHIDRPTGITDPPGLTSSDALVPAPTQPRFTSGDRATAELVPVAMCSHPRLIPLRVPSTPATPAATRRAGGTHAATAAWWANERRAASRRWTMAICV